MKKNMFNFNFKVNSRANRRINKMIKIELIII